MNPVLLFLGLSGLFVSIAGLVYSTKHAQPVPDKPLLRDDGAPVLLLGDSIGVGLEKPLRAALLPSGHDLIANVEKGRSIAAQNAHGLPSIPAETSIVLLSLGSNDTANPDSEEDALVSLVGKLRSLGLTPYWILPPSFQKGTDAQKRVVALFARVGVEPIWVPMLPDVSQDHAMGLHPTPQGYRDYASEIATAMIGE